MSDPFIGEIKMFALDFAPKGWALCNGQLLPIMQNQALFSLLGIRYGGNGQTNFALPDLRGRSPVHFGPSVPQGAMIGNATNTLTINHLPMHTHFLSASASSATSRTPANNSLAQPNTETIYGNLQNVTHLTRAIAPAGGSQPLNNMQPYLVLNYCIALQGVFPSRN